MYTSLQCLLAQDDQCFCIKLYNNSSQKQRLEFLLIPENLPCLNAEQPLAFSEF